jgi:FkbM family methyltransferase
VSCFEFEPHNLELLRHNLCLNPRLSRRIDGIESALWDRAGEQVPFRKQGLGTVIEPSGEGRAKTDTIDDLIERGVVGRVDFIKFDIEGAELNALRGAESALRRFRPRLAIAAYHRADDLATIPEYLSSLDVGYRFRLGHPTMHSEETVLFACADGDRATSRRGPRIERVARRLSTRYKPFARESGH